MLRGSRIRNGSGMVLRRLHDGHKNEMVRRYGEDGCGADEGLGSIGSISGGPHDKFPSHKGRDTSRIKIFQSLSTSFINITTIIPTLQSQLKRRFSKSSCCGSSLIDWLPKSLCRFHLPSPFHLVPSHRQKLRFPKLLLPPATPTAL